MKKILIVTDGKPGHENQSKALCEALGREFDLARVAYRHPLCKALSYAADRCALRSRRLFDAEMPPGEYDAVVCTGSTAFYPAKVIAAARGLPVCAILFPRGYRLDFDCILAPAFDNPPRRANIIPLPVNLTAVNREFYERETAAFLQRHTPAKPAAAVIIGGPNAYAALSADAMKEQLDALFRATGGMERWVTTSRRTPPEVEELVDRYPFDYKLIFSREKFNPIPAFVSLCDTLFVTADSTGMLSEAVTHGSAAVEVLMNLRGTRSKFARFIEGLTAGGCARIFDGERGRADRKIDLSTYIEQARDKLFP